MLKDRCNCSGIEPGQFHFIKTFRRLPVPLLLLGTQFSGPCGNRIALGKHAVAFHLVPVSPDSRTESSFTARKNTGLPTLAPHGSRKEFSTGVTRFRAISARLEDFFCTCHIESRYGETSQNQPQQGQDYILLHKSSIMAVFVLTSRKPAVLRRKKEKTAEKGRKEKRFLRKAPFAKLSPDRIHVCAGNAGSGEVSSALRTSAEKTDL